MDSCYSTKQNELLLCDNNAVSDNNTGTSAFDEKIDRVPPDFTIGVHPTAHCYGFIGEIEHVITISDTDSDSDDEPIIIQPEDANFDSAEIKPEICDLHSQEQALTNECNESNDTNDKTLSTTQGEHTDPGEKTVTVAVKYEDIDEQLKTDVEVRRERSEIVSVDLSNIESQKPHEEGVVVKCEDTSEHSWMDVKVANDDSNTGVYPEDEPVIEYDVVMKEEISQQGSGDLIVEPQVKKSRREKMPGKQPCRVNSLEKKEEKKASRQTRQVDSLNKRAKKQPLRQSRRVDSLQKKETKTPPKQSCRRNSLQKKETTKPPKQSCQGKGLKKREKKKPLRQSHQVDSLQKKEKICRKCKPNRHFKTLQQLKIHRRCHDPKRNHVCKVCRLRFMDTADLKRHMREHFSTSYYPCGVCGVSFTELEKLDAHAKRHKSERARKTCEVCNKIVRGKLEAHRNKHHRDMYTCLKCSKRCPTAQSLALHKCYKEEKPIICEVCGDVFSLPNYLRYHMTLHGGEITHFCHLCGEGYTHWFYLDKHFASAHPNEPCYACYECDQKFHKKARLTRHQKMHSKDRPYPCNVCNIRFVDKSSFKTHMNKHGGEIPFSCTECGIEFQYKFALTGHRWHCKKRPSRPAVKRVRQGIRKSSSRK